MCHLVSRSLHKKAGSGEQLRVHGVFVIVSFAICKNPNCNAQPSLAPDTCVAEVQMPLQERNSRRCWQG
jgi:hypothetical protein